MRSVSKLLLFLCAIGSRVLAAPVCDPGNRVAPLQAAMEQGRFIAYQPTELKIVDGKPTRASVRSIRDDLRVLRDRFDGLITYGSHSGGEVIAAVARELRYRAVIVGVWDIDDSAEVSNALDAWRRHPSLVVGVSLGNEIVFGKRGDFAKLARAVAAVRAQAPGLALTTTEPFHLYHDPAAGPLLARLDFLLVNAHPIFQEWFNGGSTSQAAEFVGNVVHDLESRFCGPILVKEASVPSGPEAAGYSTARQASFFRHLRIAFAPAPRRAFAYFAAFDAPWRVADAHPTPGPHPEEAFFGLYDAARRPKPVIAEIPPLHVK